MSGPATPSARVLAQEERERWSASSEVALSRPFVLGATLVLVGAAAVTVVATGTPADGEQAEDMRRVLDTTTALAGLAVFALCRATWRQIGDRAALWAGTAVLVVAVAAATRPHLAGALLGDRGPDDSVLTAVSSAATAVAPFLFGAGLVPRVQRLRMGAAGLSVAALALVGLLGVVLRAAPELAPVLSVTQLTTRDGAGSVAGGVLAVGVWMSLAVGYTVRGLRRRWLYTWGGPLLFALTLSGLAAGAAGPGNGWAVGAAALAALGVLSALIGCHLELIRAYEDQSLLLFDSTLEAETAEVRERVRAANLRARRHDLINAVTAIDGAAMILEREFERLSGSDRETLARVLGSGSARLRRLVSQEGGAEFRVSLADTAFDVAHDPSTPADVQLDVPPGLVAAGSPGETAEAVRQLVDYARRRAPGSPVTLRGERDGEWVVLRVEDRGQTMPRQVRRTVVDSESRWLPGHEDAIGLRVAARLIRGQGGDVWVEGRPGGGTSFGLCLPALPATNGEAVDADV